MKRIVVVGAGFSGLWAAIGAVRKLDELGIGPDAVKVTVINRDRWHAIRVRNYETDLSDIRVPLRDVLDPVGIDLIVGEVTAIDLNSRTAVVSTEQGVARTSYDCLVLAAGSELLRPDIPGLKEHAFDIDTYGAASRLDRHLRTLTGKQQTVAIVGGGLTGIELACEMPDRLRTIGLTDGRVVLLDARPHIGSDMGAEAVRVITAALGELKVETSTGVVIDRIDRDGMMFADGERLGTQTVVWTAGMRASPLAAAVPIARDRMGRLPVDTFLRVTGQSHVFAAGDIAAAPLPGGHTTVMSCQFSRPMGRLAGHNAVSDLLGRSDLIPLEIDRYATCLDLGPWGAVYTHGWNRAIVAEGKQAKTVKQTINCLRIYPPRSRDRRELLDAAAPTIQAPPVLPQRAHAASG